MGLFPSANDFKAGKGVEKDAPRKTGIGRFFELVGRDMNSMFLANLLTCLGFVPVISLVYIGFLMNNLPVMLISAAVGGILAGPVLAGMYDTVLRALRDEAGYWWVTYRKAFKRNFKASILPGGRYARQDAGLEIALECLAVGRPPVTGLITQGTENGIVHAGQRRARQNAAHSGTDQHHGEAVHQKADVDQADDREKAQAGEQVCKEHAAHIAAHQLEETAYAGLAGSVFLHARPRFEIICRGE